jgi:hypothetical protein
LSGAKALTSVFRNTWLVEKHPEEKGSVLMMRAKGNLAGADASKALKFRIQNIEDTGIMVDDGETIKNIGMLVWEGETDHTADEVLQAVKGGGAEMRKKEKETKAVEMLKEFLSGGARLAKDFYEKASELGLGQWDAKKAKNRLRLKQRNIYGQWYWGLDEGALDIASSTVTEESTRRERITVSGQDPKPRGATPERLFKKDD